MVKNDDGQFAHGDDLQKAFQALRDKEFGRISKEKRIDIFINEHRPNVKYSASSFFNWHHRLTGSCEAGRKAFCINHGIDIDHDEYTVDEFIALTRDDYGCDVIRELEKAWKAFNGA